MKAKVPFMLIAMFAIGVMLTGCAMFRYTIIPQENKGPHGGALTFIDQRVPDYVEFVAVPGETEWIFQVYVYDKNMRQRHICGGGYLTIVMPDGIKKGVDLWSKGKGHLENKMQMSNIKEFLAHVSILRGRSRDRLTFKYPYDQKGDNGNEKN